VAAGDGSAIRLWAASSIRGQSRMYVEHPSSQKPKNPKSKRDQTIPLPQALASFLARRKYECVLRVAQAQISKKKS
jgi:hypothetical protein